MKRKIFVDSDVVLSSLISSKGAAYFLLNKVDLNLFISKSSIQELHSAIEDLRAQQTQPDYIRAREILETRRQVEQPEEGVAEPAIDIETSIAEIQRLINDGVLVSPEQIARAQERRSSRAT